MSRKKEPKPWFRTWRKETPRFRQLPLYVRAIAGEILKLTDDEGVIWIGDKAPSDAIAFALGATKGDRRMLVRDVEALLAAGYFRHDGDRLVAANFRLWQDREPGDDVFEPPASRARTSNEPTTNRREPSTNEQRTGDEPPRTVNEPSTRGESTSRNHSVARPVLLSESEREGDTEGEGDTRVRASTPAPSIPTLDEIASTFGTLRKAAGGGGYKRNRSQFRDEERLRAIEHWLASEADPKASLDGAIRGFLACDRSREAGFQLAWFANDIGSHLARFERTRGKHTDSEGADPALDELNARRRELVAQRDAAIRDGDWTKREEVQRELQNLSAKVRAHVAARQPKGDQAA